MVPRIRSRLSLRFWIADADISWDSFRETENTTAPKIQNTDMIERSSHFPRPALLLPCFSSILTPHFTAQGDDVSLTFCIYDYYTLFTLFLSIASIETGRPAKK